MNEIALEGEQAGRKIAEAFMGAIDGIESSLAKLLTGQKTDFKRVFQSFAEQYTKAEIQKGVGEIAKHVPGLSGLLSATSKPDGTSGNPLNVKIVGGLQAPGSSSSGAWGKNPFGIPESMPKNWGITDDFQGNAVYGPISAASNSFDFGDLIPDFGGFMAEGGDLTPGKRYIVGEKGPEILNVGNHSGSITPNRSLREAGGGNVYEGHDIKQEFHYHGTESTDLFKRTTRQHAARQARDLSRDLGRRR